MAKVRPCKRGCGYPALKGRQFCYWHHLMRQSSEAQAQAARERYARNVVGPDQEIARVPKSEWPDGERWCAGCQSFVPLFYVSGSRCRACASSAAHSGRLRATYGIEPEEYQRIWNAQGRRCAICRNRPRTIRFAVDHDHRTGEVRGILCKRCNHDLLGGGHDSVDLLFRAIAYLLSPPAQRPAGWGPDDNFVLNALRAHLRARARKEAGRRPERQEPPF